MFSSRCLDSTGRLVGAILLALAIVALPLGAAAGPLERTTIVLEGPAAPCLAASIWHALLDLLTPGNGVGTEDRGSFEAKCGVIPDPSGICKSPGEPTPPAGRPAPVRGIFER